jgi:TM2 domain-containing membrane protein YozV
MKRNAVIGSVFSLFVPGLGQIYIGRIERGAAILMFVILIGNLNAIWLSIFAISSTLPTNFLNNTLPILIHDIFAFYGIVFWIWQAVDVAYMNNKNYYKKMRVV